MKNQYILKISNLKIYIVLDDEFIYGLHWNKQNHRMKSLTKKQLKISFDLKNSLNSYLKGDLKKFKLPYKLEGTDFQKKVWAELEKIPYGKLISYKDLAISIGDPNASRAVGTANSKNPISIIVPCHRVIQSSGMYGGYAGGKELKTQLIRRELGFS